MSQTGWSCFVAKLLQTADPNPVTVSELVFQSASPHCNQASSAHLMEDCRKWLQEYQVQFSL